MIYFKKHSSKLICARGKLIQTAEGWPSCTKYVISVGVLVRISIWDPTLDMQKYQQVWKKWNLKHKIMFSSFKIYNWEPLSLKL